MDGETAAPPRAIWYGRTPGRDTHSPEVLRGDVERMRALIDFTGYDMAFYGRGSFLASRRHGDAGTGAARHG